MELQLEKLMSALKVYTHNVQVIHRSLTGDGFFADHEVMCEYYKELQLMTDDVIEIASSFGFKEPSLEVALIDHESLSGFDVKNYEAFVHIQRIFQKLITIFDEVKEFLPDDVISKFEEYQYWLRKEANYKIAQRLK